MKKVGGQIAESGNARGMPRLENPRDVAHPARPYGVSDHDAGNDGSVPRAKRRSGEIDGIAEAMDKCLGPYRRQDISGAATKGSFHCAAKTER